MKTILKIVLFLFAFQLTYAQTNLTDYFVVGKERIEIEITKTDNKYKIKLSKVGSEDPEEFTIGSSVGSFFDFKKQFRTKVSKLLGLSTTTEDKKDNSDSLLRIDQEAESIYYSFANNLRVLDNLDFKPKTGVLKVSKTIPVYLNKIIIESLITKKGVKEIEKDFINKAKKEFESKLIDIDNLIKKGYSANINKIIELSKHICLSQYQTINTSSDDIATKEARAKAKTISLLSKDAEFDKAEKKYIKAYLKKRLDTKSKAPFTYFVVDEVEFEFSKGFLEVIKVQGYFNCDDKNKKKYNCELIPSFLKNKSSILFSNKYGIGFTSRENYKRLDNVSLYINQSDKDYSVDTDIVTLGKELKVYRDKLKDKLFIKMDDLINYNYSVNKLTRDFSPMDQKITVTGGDKLTLTKEETRKILEVEVFSDFEGFDADAPNGLIQFELSKHFNINTRRHDTKVFDWLFGGYGWIQYSEIEGGITKIEDKQRRLNPERIDTEVTLVDNSIVIDSKRYTNPVDLLNFRTWFIGQDTNFLLIDNPDLKHQFHINGGFRFNRTAIQDSIKTVGSDSLKPEEYSVSFWTFYPEVKMHLLPEERYGVYAMWRPKFVYLTSDKIDFKSTANPVTGFRRKVSNWVNEFEFKGYVDVGEKGQLFLRWRLNHEMGYSANNFSQIQLGYSFFILGRNGTSSKPN